MKRAATSIRVVGIYLLLLGAALIAVPNLVLAPFGLPPTSDVWLRVVGVLVAILGHYYVQAARHDLVPFYRASVPARIPRPTRSSGCSPSGPPGRSSSPPPQPRCITCGGA